MKRQITQKAIGFKIDLFLLEVLEQYCKVNAIKKNTAINFAIAKYLGVTP